MHLVFIPIIIGEEKTFYEKLALDDGRQASHVDAQRPIAIGHMSDSAELKIF